MRDILAHGIESVVEIRDAVKVLVLVQVQIVHVARESRPERDRQLGLQEADHRVRVGRRHRKREPQPQATQESPAVC